MVKPEVGEVVRGFIPEFNPEAVYVMVGIIGAVVMPHNIYLHSALVQTRAYSNSIEGKREACRWNLIDTILGLNTAFLINASIMIVSAGVFFKNGVEVKEIQQAHHLIEPLLGSSLAATLFGFALFLAGQSSTLTGTLSGQIVMEGFLNIKLPVWVRRLITRSVALVPAVVVVLTAGSEGMYSLLIISQIILSFQLPFALVPLFKFTSERRVMGVFANPLWFKILSGISIVLITSLNMYLLYLEIGSYSWGIIVIMIAFIIYLLMYPMERFVSFVAGGTPYHNIIHDVKPMSINSVCVAVEHSPGDIHIINTAVSIAKKYNASIKVLHVCNVPQNMVYGDEARTSHHHEDMTYLEHVAETLSNMGFEVETYLRHGEPADQIISFVKENKPDILIVGSHRHKGIEDIIWGETVSKVRHSIDIPVIVVPTGKYREAPQKS